jgi:hypothetical protein
MDFDAVLLLSFGGPEGPEQVRPFLENVTRGRNVPPERLDEVAEHYLHFGGVSPINQINRALIAQIRTELVERGLDVPVYFGNRNWEPYVEDTVAIMRDNGIRRAAVFTTSAWSGYSSCTQYVEDIARARRAAGPGAPELMKLRPYFDHPLFVQIFADTIGAASGALPAELSADARLVFTAHSIPVAVQSPSRLRRKAGRGGSRIPRLRPGLAVAIGSAAGSVAGARCRRPSFGVGRDRDQRCHHLPDRVCRRSHRGGVGSRPGVAIPGRGGTGDVDAGVYA